MKHIKLFEEFINESEIFADKVDMTPVEFEKFKESYLKLNKDNKIDIDGSDSWGFRKGAKDGHWKYDSDSMKLYHDEHRKQVLGLINFYNTTKKDHPWS